jgi:DNA-binding MarR family transcriptional regulator
VPNEPERLWQLPSWLLNRAGMHATRLVAEALQAHDARRPHYTVLLALAERGPASQADLGRMLWIDRSDLHAIVSTLEADGLISRQRDPGDRRRNVVALTAAGKRRLAQLDRAVSGAQDALLEPLDAAQREQLIALLTRVVAGQPEDG